MATTVKNKTRFVVDLGNLALTEEQSRAISLSIQSAVLSQLATGKLLDLPPFQPIDPGTGILGMFVPPDEPPKPPKKKKS